MPSGETGTPASGSASASLARSSERFVVVSDEHEWVDRVSSSSTLPVDRIPPEQTDVSDTSFDGYPAAVVVDGASPVDPIVSFTTLREQYPDTACLLAGGGGRVDRDSADTDDRSVVLEYVPERDPAGVAAAAEFAVERRTHRGYPVADDEDDRLAALRDVAAADLADGDGLDDLAATAMRALDADAASVALLGEYHLHVVGASDDRFPARVERARSVSTYTVLGGGVSEVPDLAADPRFEPDCLALEFGMRSYAGVALRVDGAAVGSLSVLCSDPGGTTADDRETLRLLAGVAEELLAAATRNPDEFGSD